MQIFKNHLRVQGIPDGRHIVIKESVLLMYKTKGVRGKKYRPK